MVEVSCLLWSLLEWVLYWVSLPHGRTDLLSAKVLGVILAIHRNVLCRLLEGL